jgi:cupin 2 domain-containing protein
MPILVSRPSAGFLLGDEHDMIVTSNIFSGISPASRKEQTTPLLSEPNVRIERIVSHGQASPPGFWYDQDQHEWVIVLQGAARLRFEGAEGAIDLAPGDHIHIPPHARHRVEWTTIDTPTVWLAVHFSR